MAADRITAVSDADRKALARRLCAGLYELWLRRQSEPAADTTESRTSATVDVRPPRAERQEAGELTTDPPTSVHHDPR